MAHNFDRLKAAVIDRRSHNVFYRQQQIQSLFKALQNNAEKFRQAIINDTGHSEYETTMEINLTISSVRTNYASLDATKFHNDEYAVANGKDAAQNSVPVGIVYIEPTTHTLLYSIIVPLSAAITAGNCVIVLLENKLRATSTLLREVLRDALSADTFAIATSPVDDSEILDKGLLVTQNGKVGDRSRINELASQAGARSIAVVDRTANVQRAAQDLVQSRFAFGGSSPYASDIVIVNEFVKEDFLQAAISECDHLSSPASRESVHENAKARSRADESIDAIKKKFTNCRILLQRRKLAVLDLAERLERIPEQKNDAPVLIVCSMRSLDDVIDLLSRSASEPYLAAYHFSNLASAKYLSQFVDARTTFVNHIPQELLIGPAFPVGHQFKLDDRCPTTLLEQGRPVLVNSSTRSTLLVDSRKSTNASATLKLWTAAKEPLSMMKRSKGGGVGFFEQGFLMNAALLITSTVAISSTGAWCWWRYSRRT